MIKSHITVTPSGRFEVDGKKLFALKKVKEQIKKLSSVKRND